MRSAEADLLVGYSVTQYWEEYLAPIPEAERGDMVKAYYKRLTGTDEKVRAEAGRAWVSQVYAVAVAVAVAAAASGQRQVLT